MPASLVQIHYHDRPGGVRQVMASYSNAFKKYAGVNASDIWICNQSGTYRYINNCKGIHCTQAEYHRYHSERAFNASVEFLTDKISEIICASDMHFPVAVIGHNLNLGKNPALSAAFANCARRFGVNQQHYRFFSVMHDFVEDGRSTILASLRRLERWGIDSGGMLYASGAPVHFITPSHCGAVLSGLKKNNITILPNRVEVREVPVKNICGALQREQLQILAKEDGLEFDPVRTLYCYPSRMIYRKNVFEAFLLTTMLLQGSLVIGAPGTAVNDRKRLEMVKRIAMKYRRSFLYDPSRLPLPPHGGALADDNPFVTLYPVVDAVVTTSGAEGFGYALFEPWRYGKMVIGRMPAGTSLLPGMMVSSLYDRLPIPVAWVSVAECHRYFTDSYRQAFGIPYVPLQTFMREFILEDTIDFGLLDERQQITIVNKLNDCDDDLAALIAMLRNRMHGWPGLGALETADCQVILQNEKFVRTWSDSGFIDAFANCLSVYPQRPDNGSWYTAITDHFQQIGYFRPHVIP
jgi:hypothetical protein